jgi:four helix bundle protein
LAALLFQLLASELGMNRVPAKSFQDFSLWQKAHQFVLSVYHYSDYFPQKEIYGLTPQFRRAAISAAANIAEGFKKKSGHERARFLKLAHGSLEACRYYLVLAKDLGYGDNPELMPQLEEVSQLLEEYTTAILDSGS